MSAVIRKPATQGAVKNKSAAPVQITADQILREALDRKEIDPKPPVQKITDAAELAEYRMRKRKEFEDRIRRSRTTLTYYIKYAQWEESQGEMARARSVFERSLEVDYRNSSLWLKYSEMEIKNRNINHARNILDRAVTLLPRVDQLWYKYSYMEEMLGNVPGARQIFERWMEWEPDDNGWTSYIKLELRYNEIDRARALYERYVVCHNTTTAWLKYAKFEDRRNAISRARDVFTRSLEALEGTEYTTDETLYMAFAKFEERVKEFERARAIYKFALDIIPKVKAQELYKTYTAFEKQHGTRESVEDVVVSKRRFHYEEELKKNSLNYDVWFDYARLEESISENFAAVREVYERAIANVPPSGSKNRWRRYIYLWINYALFEELEACDMERTRAVYQECLRLIPHRKFSFSKIWILASQFEIRQHMLENARKILGNAIGLAPKQKIFTAYIDIEYQLSNIDRCRKLYEAWLKHDPANCEAWIQYAHMEQSLDELERARALFEMAVAQPLLDTPEVMWKCYIDFEIQAMEYDRVRALYKRLLEKTHHVKVWISFAQFETSVEELERARKVFEDANKTLKTDGENKEERAMLLQSWKEFETEFGDENMQKQVDEKLPRRVKKRRPLLDDNGEEAGWEEYFDYIFPDEEAMTSASKLLELAQKWKQKQAVAQQQADESNNNNNNQDNNNNNNDNENNNNNDDDGNSSNDDGDGNASNSSNKKSKNNNNKNNDNNDSNDSESDNSSGEEAS